METLIHKEPNLQISKSELSQLFEFVIAQRHFLFQSKIYDQINGVEVGPPLAHVLVNLFMGYHENNWLNNCFMHFCPGTMVTQAGSISSDLQRGLDRRLRHTQYRTQNRTTYPLKYQRTTNTTATLVV